MNLRATKIPESILPTHLLECGLILRSECTHLASLHRVGVLLLQSVFAGREVFDGPVHRIVHAVILHDVGGDATVLYDEDAFMACQPARPMRTFMPAVGDWRPKGTETDSGYLIADPTPGARTVVHSGAAPAFPAPFDFWDMLFGPGPHVTVKAPEARGCGNPDCPTCWPYGRF